MNPIDSLNKSLTTLKALILHWPTDQQIRDRRDTLSASTGRSSTFANPDALPFGLDRTLDTETKTRTFQGACDQLSVTRWQWANYLDRSNPDVKDPIRNIDWLLTNLSRYNELPPHYRQYTMQRLSELASDCVHATARGAEATTYPCPACSVGTLERPYTSDGLLDLLVCSKCNETWTRDQHERLAHVHARLRPIEFEVTLAEAAEILDQPLGTLHARVTRGQIEPVGRRGRRKTYWLDDLK